MSAGAARLILPAALALAGPAAAQAPNPAPPTAEIRAAAGPWELEIVDRNRKCRLMLRPEPATVRGGRSEDHAIAFPATCRMAIPLLAGVVGWRLSPEGRLALVGAAGNARLEFPDARAGSPAEARSGGERYRIMRVGPTRRVRQQPAAERAAIAQAEQARQRTQVDPALAPPAESLPGRYGMMRFDGRVVCELELAVQPAAPPIGPRASLARVVGACGDQGILIFDPAGWRYERGRLTLVARRGHDLGFVPQAGGVWRKDPNVGATLNLRRL